MKTLKITIDKVPGIWTADSASTLPEGYLSPHFRESEFTCNHCGSLKGKTVSQELIDALEDLRSHFGDAPVTVNSGFRCETHNRNVGGAPNSRHLYADAADIVVSQVPPSNVADYLESKDPARWGIGRYGTFTHLDTRGYSARWTG